MTVKRSMNEDVSFPKIYVCQTSHHSLTKIKQLYPEVSLDLVHALYYENGTELFLFLFLKNIQDSYEIPEELANIDALEFFSATRPNFELITCIYENGSYHESLTVQNP